MNTPDRHALLLSRRPALFLAALLLAGCTTVGPTFQAPPSAAPADWSAWRSGDPELRQGLNLTMAPLPQQWWTVFKDATLNDLESRAQQSSLDLQTAALRFAQARTQRAATFAQRLPTLDASAAAHRNRDSETGASTRLITGIAPSGGARDQLISLLSSPYNLYQTGFDASWEIDLWGRVRRGLEKADADLESSSDMLAQSRLSIESEVARSYFELRTAQRQLLLARADIAAAEETLQLASARAQGGLTDQVDVKRQGAQLADLKARLPQLLAQEASAINQIGVLVGAHPGELNDTLATPAPAGPAAAQAPREATLPDLALGLPSDLTQRRPDIRQAEDKLHAATANIGVAEGDLLPRITLGASFGFESLLSNQLTDWGSRRWSVGPGISLPIFDGGRRRRVVELRKLEQQEAAVSFQQTVLKAWQEVDDALNSYNAEHKRNLQLQEKQRNSREAYDLAQAKYKGGMTDFLSPLDAQRTLLQAERDLADSDNQLRARLVAVYKAIGGGGPGLVPATASNQEGTPASR
ncbi:MAG TPA: efflux transporter outer membrane subunit [Burkholderiales bacterium]